MKICINKLRLFGHHGLKKVEKENGQYFDFYIEFILTHNLMDKDKDGFAVFNDYRDDIAPIIDYEDVIRDVKNIFDKKRYNLLESLVYALDSFLREKYNLSFLKIKVSKPDAPIKYDCENISVESVWGTDE